MLLSADYYAFFMRYFIFVIILIRLMLIFSLPRRYLFHYAFRRFFDVYCRADMPRHVAFAIDCCCRRCFFR